MQLLVVVHSRTGGTRALADAVLEGARDPLISSDPDLEPVEVVERAPTEVDADVLRGADGVILATPEHFGAMAGLVKDMFERVYYEIIDETRGRPFALVVKGRHDGTGTVRGVTAITTGLGWKAVLPPLVVIGDVTDAHRDEARELGATVAAGLSMGLF